MDILLKDLEIKISDLMSKCVIAASPKMKIEDTDRLMFLNGVSMLPVIDENDKITGIISYYSLGTHRESDSFKTFKN